MILILLITLLISGCLSPLDNVMVSDQQTQRALEIAKQQKRSPYVWGGRGPDIFDCSGLITYSYKQALGKERIFKVGNYETTDATMNDLHRYNVILIPPRAMQPGDIVFITRDENRITHGGLFNRWIEKYEKFEVLHASSYSNPDQGIESGVRLENWSIKGLNRGQWFAGAGRLKLY